jgi:ribosomal protein S14
MHRIAVVAALIVTVTALPAAAFAHRRATRGERSAILAAVVRQHELSRAQADCQVVTISTVNRNYAAVTWPAKLSRACLRVAANGVIIEHRQSSGWHFVTVGSAIRCPIKGVPTRVARDLSVCT